MFKSLKIVKTESVLDNLETLEIVDMTLLDKVIASDKLNTEKYVFCDGMMEYDNEREFLLKIKKQVKNNKLKVTYKRAKNGIGRVYFFKGLSLGGMRRAVRHTLAKENYTDIDIENCHPNILQQLCKANGVKNKLLTQYCKDRNNILKLLGEYYNVSRDAMKKLFLILSYGGSVKTWEREFNLININHEPFVIKYSEELRLINENLSNQNPELIKIIEKEKKEKNKVNDNPFGSLSSMILQEYERRILEVVYLFFKEAKGLNMDNTVLCYDGLMILSSLFNPDMLAELSEYVQEHSGFKLNFTVKEMDEDFLSDINEVFTVDPSKTESLDIEYFKTLRTYEQKKIYFELFVGKVMQPNIFVFNSLNKSMLEDECFYTYKGIRECFKQLNSGKYDKSNNETKFIDEWLNDENLKLYNVVDFQPYNLNEQKNLIENDKVYNTFKGYNPLIYSEYNKDKHDQILKPFNSLGIELCEGNPEYWIYFKMYLAHMIQKPSERLPLAFIIKGNQGTGKSLFLNTIGNLINDKYYTSSSDMSDFFGRFATGFLNKLLVNLDEAEGRDTFDFEGKMKTAITSEKIRIEKKGFDQIYINNYARLIITTNKNNPIRIDVKERDRRYVVFNTTDKFLNKKTYTGDFWTKLAKYFKTPEFVAALYNELNEMDISKLDPLKRPITKSYKALAAQSYPIESLFLEDLITEKYSLDDSKISSQKVDILGSDLYDIYKSYCSQYVSDKAPKSLKKFYTDFNALNFPIEIVKPQNKTTYRFSPNDCFKYMLARGFREANENDDTFLEDDRDENGEGYDSDFEILL